MAAMPPTCGYIKPFSSTGFKPVLAVKGSHQRGMACDVAVHGFQQVGARSCCRQIEFLVERENFKGVMVGNPNILWRTRRPIAEISTLSGKAIGLAAAIGQICAGWRHVFRKLVRGWRHVPDHPV